MKELRAYVFDGHELRIRPAPIERDWMDNCSERYPYRCLPLDIANAHGWEILCTSAFSAYWDGRPTKDAIRILRDCGNMGPFSHFGNGVLSFHPSCLFRTDPGVDLFVTGPINRPKDGIAPLTGVVETDWSPYTFTMNWLFTRSNLIVRFEVGEPFCHVFPVRRGELETVTPAIHNLSDDPDLEREYKLWSANRKSFLADRRVPGSKAAREGWQKSYFRGLTHTGQPAPTGHCSRLRLQRFVNRNADAQPATAVSTLPQYESSFTSLDTGVEGAAVKSSEVLSTLAEPEDKPARNESPATMNSSADGISASPRGLTAPAETEE